MCIRYTLRRHLRGAVDERHAEVLVDKAMRADETDDLLPGHLQPTEDGRTRRMQSVGLIGRWDEGGVSQMNNCLDSESCIAGNLNTRTIFLLPSTMTIKVESKYICLP